MKIGTLFSGFGGVDLGAQAAGLELAWGVELDPVIAAVAECNLNHDVRVANLLDCDPSKFAPVDVLHASPPCPNFSVANANSSETELDIALARKVAEFVTKLQPRIVTLENVWAYRNSESWRIVEDALYGAGYWLHVDHVNCADYGVPQTRKRMIVRAVKGGFVPYLPEPTPWIGWYEAIEDLLPTLPESVFAPWQLARLPELSQTVLIPQGGAFEGADLPVRPADLPSPTVTANHNQLGVKAFLMQVQGEGGDGVRYSDEPMQTVASNHGAAKYRAYLIENVNTSRLATVRGDGEPCFTVTADDRPSHRPTALLVNESSTMEVRAADEPSAAQVASPRNLAQRALVSAGRVVAMTPRALARFQSFPDWYKLPDNAPLAAKGIGNAVPPLLYQRIIASLLETL